MAVEIAYKEEALIDLDLIDDGMNMRSNIQQLTEANEELVQSIIANDGVMQAVGVYPVGDRFKSIYGQRRIYCSRIAGMKQIRARIYPPPKDDAEPLILGTQENTHRVDADPVEFGEALKMIKEIRGWTSEEVSRAVCLNPVKVSRLIQLANQPVAIKELVRNGTVGVTPALELGKLPDEERQILISRVQAGATISRDQLVGRRKGKDKDEGNDRKKNSRVTAVLESGNSVIVCGDVTTLDKLISVLEELISQARRERPKGVGLKTFLAMLKDRSGTA